MIDALMLMSTQSKIDFASMKIWKIVIKPSGSLLVISAPGVPYSLSLGKFTAPIKY